MMKLTVIFLAVALCLATFAHADEAARENVGLENCNCISTYEYTPLCASNGVTYSNKGMLNCAKNCLKLSGLEKVSDGPCKH